MTPSPVLVAFDATDTEALATFSETDAGPTLSGLAVPFAVASGPSSTDGSRYRFTTPPRNADELVNATVEHDRDAVIGKLAAPFAAVERGLHAVARLFDTTRGRDAVVEAREGVRASFSVGAIVHRYQLAEDGVRDVLDWTADHLGVVRRPAFSEASGIVLQCSAADATETTTRKDAPPMTGSPTVVELPTTAELAAAVAAELSFPTVAELAEQVAEKLGTRRDTHPLAVYTTFGHYLDAVYSERDPEKASALVTAFAVADQISANNPGVNVPGWRMTLQANLDDRRPAISLSGGSIGLADGGLSVSWPYFDGDLDGLIAEQATQKTDLSGVRVDIKKGDASVKTAGAVSDISYQLIERSTPSYREAYLRIMFAGWARYTEAKYEAELVSKGTDAGALPAFASAGALRAWLFEASLDVEDATGKPATYALVDRATFVELGGHDALFTPQYGNTGGQAAAGTADAASLSINVAGIEVKHGPFLAADTAIVSNDVAAKFSETGPRVATAEDVRKLGQDVAVWGMYVPGEVYFPGGVQVYKPGA